MFNSIPGLDISFVCKHCFSASAEHFLVDNNFTFQITHKIITLHLTHRIQGLLKLFPIKIVY